MPNERGAISNTSPLLYLYRYLYRIGRLDWLPLFFTGIWAPSAVQQELREGERRGYDVPVLHDYSWLEIRDPATSLEPVMNVGRAGYTDGA
jgi:hypothetical protein